MKLILLLPLIVYLCLMLVNIELLKDFQSVNIFWALILDGPVVMFSSVFFVLYGILVYLTYSWINSYQAHKIKKLDSEITRLKSELYTNQKGLIDELKQDYKNQLASFKQDNDHKFETMIRYNQYTLEKVIDETHGSYEKYRKETQKLLREAKADTTFLEKLKVWKR